MVTVKSFEKFLNSLCCNNCIYNTDGKCTHANYLKNETQKQGLANAYKQTYEKGFNEPGISNARKEMLENLLEKSKNINEVYLCGDFEDLIVHPNPLPVINSKID